MILSQRAMNLQPSATLAVTARAKEMKSQGKPVISFGAGEPDFVSPEPILDAAREAIDQGHTHYTPNPGIPELREAICDDYKRRFNLEYKSADVLVGSGAKPLLYCALASLINDGDEVIVIAPAWVSYVEQIHLCGGREVIVESGDTQHCPSIDRLRAALTDRTRCIMINSPNNPSGAVYDKATLKAIAELAIEKNLVIINDEIYERLVYEGSYTQILQACPEAVDRVVNINGVSKAYAMTGWRIGYALGPSKLIKAMAAIQGHLTSNASSIAQYAALGGLRYAEDEVEAMRTAFSARRDLVISKLKEISGLSFVSPKGAFYVLVDVTRLLGKKHDSVELVDDATLCADLLETRYVAITPGSAFYAPGTMRISYANSEQEIIEGIDRLASYVKELQ